MGQPSHWTYCSYNAADHLQQGDIIRRSPALLKVLSDVLAHFCDERYTAFLIITQTCDLVQRNEGPCRAEYINLCVIRELKPLLPVMLEPCCGAGIPGVFASDNRLDAEQLVKRILNQNEQARGLFYLHHDSDAGIDTPSVALLRVSIALRRDHYGLLQECRCGRVHPEYSAKLGWLTGNLYSRVATLDWEDQEGNKTASSKQARALLRLISKPKDENWVPAKWVKAAREKDIDLAHIPVDRFRTTLAEHAPPELLDVVLKSVQRVGRGVVVDESTGVIGAKLTEHSQFIREVAHSVAASSSDLLSPEEQDSLTESLAADAGFKKAIGDQVAHLLKKIAIQDGSQAANDLPEALREATGVLPPAQNRMRAVLSNLLGEDRANVVNEIIALVARTNVFSQAACQMVGGVVQEVWTHVDFGLLDKLTSRLKSDQKLGAACREATSERPRAFLAFE